MRIPACPRLTTSSKKHELTNFADLSAAIDVYSEWIDACDAVAKEAPDVTGKSARTSYRDIDHTSRAQASQGAGEMDDFVEDDEDAEADFLDE